jgi:phosphatidylglycerophosphatase C
MGRKVPESNQLTIAAFDFDGTITKSDTLPIFIFCLVNFVKLIVGSIRILPSLVLFKFRIIPNYDAKEKLFITFFSGMEINYFNSVSSRFSSKIDTISNPNAIQKIKWHQDMGHIVLIISASAENWIIPWANKNGIKDVIATKLEVVDGKITGHMLTRNCHGAEKVNRLLEIYPHRKDYTLYAYGDSNGDKELLALADYSYYRSFE